MNKFDNIHHTHQHQPVEGASLKVDLGPVTDLLHILVANWLTIALFLVAGLMIFYLFNWAAAASVKAVRPVAKRPWGNVPGAAGDIKILVFGGAGGFAGFAAYFFGIQTLLAPITYALHGLIQSLPGLS